VNTQTAAAAAPSKAATGLIEVHVSAIRYAAHETNIYEFKRPDGAALPPYQPGAHIDLHLPNGLIRQYSLIEPEPDPATYTVSVKRDPASRGGSRCVHDELRVGKLLTISAPRNNFLLVENADQVNGAAARQARPLLEALLRLPLARRHGVPRSARSHGLDRISFR